MNIQYFYNNIKNSLNYLCATEPALVYPANNANAQNSLSTHDLLVNIESFLTHISSEHTEWINLSPDANVVRMA